MKWVDQDFFARLGPVKTEELRKHARQEGFSPEEVLVTEGEPADRVIILLEGRTKVTQHRDGADEVVLLGFCGPGELIGELAVIDGDTHSSTVTALDPVEALVIPAVAFREQIDKTPGFAMSLLETLSRRFRNVDRERIEFARSDSLGRVCARLVVLCERHSEPANGGLVITLPFSENDLAHWAVCSTQAVSKALRTLREFGWIENDGSLLVVLNLEALRERARL